MKVKIDFDEMYPVYFADKTEDISWGREVELPEADWETYKQVCREWRHWQDRLRGLHATAFAPPAC